MLWIKEHTRIWRLTIIVLLLVAFIGPWSFDLINVPAEYTCSAPNIRLYGDFCGMPMSGLWLYRWMFGGLIMGLVTGEFVFFDVIREFLLSLLLFLPLLPVVSTAFMLMRRDQKRWQVFTVTAWGLAVGFSLFMGINSILRKTWLTWGLWLYIGLAACGLILEVLSLSKGRRPSQG